MRSRKLKLKNWKSKKKNMKGGHWYPFSTITHKYNIYRDNGQFLKPILWIVYPTFRQRFMLNGQAPTFFLTNGVYTMTYVQSFSDFICYVIFNAFLSFWSFFFLKMTIFFAEISQFKKCLQFCPQTYKMAIHFP